ncbi:flagellar biosynthesis protein FlgA [Mycobacterium florentinum]|uniref:Flagellar biosynthesis protein FlgA n=1 Tax=Mycobacterium florentinum TaxID=292462 RepID=A0A1X1UKT0_MYCFL|nr:SAF domain-containing protein [Mycobacterium florentinum]MCV7411446.1 flagellar biosynthesis protein FlgA [Mycobacterium florentinum]ORV57402.1 flagellar biosynthesis protein FlgA [Mycobacterium florentinum]
MGEPSLNPALLQRISASLRPDWTRTVLARRVVAGGLVVLAGVAAVHSNPDGDRVDVVVATRDLTPGAALTPDDVRVEKRLATTLPDGSQADPGAVVGSMLAGPARRGEVLTDVRLLGSRLAELTAGPGARIVPLHLTDGALIDLVRAGDVVDVLAAPPTESQPGTQAISKVVATDAVVVLVSPKQKVRAADDDRVVLVALPARVANTVAGSVLGQAVTLTLH